ncbi:insulin gene enhancer protein ISL-1 [Grus japonensis]|uniref:Insulin gene enhancer protein ISL-1 n=1 Tax=Grus japonensis TaxID=30415 RepID=A0ABC9Y2G7_GRUJA
MVEATTGWLETYPVPHATSQNTILGLEKQVLWGHGTPERSESDNGTHFRNNLIDTWAKEHGIEWVYHIPCHAPASGKIERLYGIKCAKCSIGFSKNDFVMRARTKVYHIECFRCVACSRQLIPGDEFALREDGLFCRADHDVMERASLGAGDPLSPLHPAQLLQMAAEPISARQPALRPHVHKQPEKTTRVRTVLNEKQLHTLRTCYAANPRPDALMKEQLVEMTGLSPRVIRVWFQNKRCKDKKRSIMMKQLQQQQPNNKTNIQGMTGTPMVAASPERHDGGLQANPVEVQSYQPPWKVLSDFALQSDIDQPAFQQLVNFSEGGPGSNSTGSEVASMSSQLPDTPNSMVASPIEA